MATDWISFWDSPHAIYVNARHRDVHYRLIAEDERPYVPSSDAVVMDYGCGEALHADIVAAAARRLVLVEAAPGVVAGLRTRFSAHPNIEVWTPDDVARSAAGTFDLIVLHSVAQYLSAADLDALLRRFHDLLKADGRLVVGDIIPPQQSMSADALSLLRFAAAHRFLIAAAVGLVRTALSDYRKLRQALGLSLYDERDMLAKLAAAGFTARRMPHNIGHNQARMAFLAQPRQSAISA